MFLIVTLSFDLSKEWKHLEEKIGPGLLRECCRLVTETRILHFVCLPWCSVPKDCLKKLMQPQLPHSTLSLVGGEDNGEGDRILRLISGTQPQGDFRPRLEPPPRKKIGRCSGEFDRSVYSRNALFGLPVCLLGASEMAC